MSNLENLVSKITEDSTKKAQAIMDDANANAEKIIQAKVDEANHQKEQILHSAQVEAGRTKEQIIAGKKLELRDKKLMAKQQVILETFEKAAEKLKKLSDADFAKFLERYLFSMNIVGDEAIILPKRYQGIDLNKINAKLKEKNALGELTLDKEGKEIDGGFILVRNGVENNNTFEALLDYYREELEVMVVENLF